MDFQGFLNNLQDWETSLDDKDKKLKSRGSDKAKLGNGLVGEERRPMTKDSTIGNPSAERQNDYRKKYDSMMNFSSNLMTEEHSPDAASEKDLGNEYFKKKKYNEAIDCYSRSIALSPTAVAYANRAMAYLKIKRFQEAEVDCTEALNLDDRNIKAYSRRSTARKELGKLKQSLEDSEFALRLEPQNQEVKKQYNDTKFLYDKEMLEKVSAQLTNSTNGVQKAGKSTVSVNRQVGVAQSVPSNSQKMGFVAVQDDQKKGNHKRQELKPSVQELAARAASLAQSEAAKHITPPKTAYQFEVSWRGLASDRTQQACLLKATSATALPQIFKNALSANILIDVIRCIATFVFEDMDLAVKYLENLTKVSRFDMIIMCLSPTDRSDMHRIWDEVFCSNATPIEFAERLDKLRPRYCN